MFCPACYLSSFVFCLQCLVDPAIHRHLQIDNVLLIVPGFEPGGDGTEGNHSMNNYHWPGIGHFCAPAPGVPAGGFVGESARFTLPVKMRMRAPRTVEKAFSSHSRMLLSAPSWMTWIIRMPVRRTRE